MEESSPETTPKRRTRDGEGDSSEVAAAGDDCPDVPSREPLSRQAMDDFVRLIRERPRQTHQRQTYQRLPIRSAPDIGRGTILADNISRARVAASALYMRLHLDPETAIVPGPIR
jgi:hypothetical protein